MITLYSGTPGSGKSLHISRDIISYLNSNKNVIANFSIDYTRFKKRKKKGVFYEFDNFNMSVSLLKLYAKKFHKFGKEGQTLLIIDECQMFFNPREFSRSDRLEWNNFFSQHRKLGFEIILCTQNDRLIDRQIRSLLEYEVKHRKVNNFKFAKFVPVSLFCAITYWYGVRERVSSEFFIYRKSLGSLYDSYKMFE